MSQPDDLKELVLRVLALEAENRELKKDVEYHRLNARKWREWHDELKAGKTAPQPMDDRFTFGT